MKLFAEPIFRRPARAPKVPATPRNAPCNAEPDLQQTEPSVATFDDRLEQLRETFDLLEVDVVRLIGEVTQAGETADQDIGDLTKSTTRISAGSAELAASAENAAQHLRRLANAGTELKASGEEINRRLHDVSALTIEGRKATQDAHASVEGLKTSSGEIGAIVGLINSVARKIDLVALNSMIEAARAGEAGKSFGVVAGEVKQPPPRHRKRPTISHGVSNICKSIRTGSLRRSSESVSSSRPCRRSFSQSPPRSRPRPA